MIEQKIDPPPTWGFEILPKYTFHLHLHLIKKNQFGVSQIGKCSKETKFVKYRKFLILNPIFLYDRAKNRSPPTWGFEILLKFTFNLHLHLIKKNQFGVSQIGKCSKETKFVKYRKF